MVSIGGVFTGDAQIEKGIHYTMSICNVPWCGLELTRKDSQKSLLNPARLVIEQDLQVCDLLISYLNAFYCPPLKVLLPTFKMLQICAVSLATTTGRHGHCPLDRLNHQNKPSHGEDGEKGIKLKLNQTISFLSKVRTTIHMLI